MTGAGKDRAVPPPLPEAGGAPGEEQNTQPQSEGGDSTSVWVSLKSEEGDMALASRSNSLRKKTHFGQRRIRTPPRSGAPSLRGKLAQATCAVSSPSRGE